jgi:hypothetical protein
MEVQFLVAQAREAKSDWDTAVDVYKCMYVVLSDDPSEAVQQRKLFMSISRGFYETREYDSACYLDGALK